jgi:hypothetical protein
VTFAPFNCTLAAVEVHHHHRRRRSRLVASCASNCEYFNWRKFPIRRADGARAESVLRKKEERRRARHGRAPRRIGQAPPHSEPNRLASCASRLSSASHTRASGRPAGQQHGSAATAPDALAMLVASRFTSPPISGRGCAMNPRAKWRRSRRRPIRGGLRTRSLNAARCAPLSHCGVRPAPPPLCRWRQIKNCVNGHRPTDELEPAASGLQPGQRSVVFVVRPSAAFY